MFVSRDVILHVRADLITMRRPGREESRAGRPYYHASSRT